jgi:hypothetical protein
MFLFCFTLMACGESATDIKKTGDSKMPDLDTSNRSPCTKPGNKCTMQQLIDETRAEHKTEGKK